MKETFEVTEFVVEAINATNKSLADGNGFQGADLINFAGAAIKLPMAIVGIDQVDEEIRAMSDLDRENWKALFKEKLELRDKGKMKKISKMPLPVWFILDWPSNGMQSGAKKSMPKVTGAKVKALSGLPAKILPERVSLFWLAFFRSFEAMSKEQPFRKAQRQD